MDTDGMDDALPMGYVLYAWRSFTATVLFFIFPLFLLLFETWVI